MSASFLLAYPYAQYVAVGVALIGLFVWQNARNSAIAVPTFGSEIPILSTIDALRYMLRRPKYIKEYYSKYPAFKLANLSHWILMLDNSYVEEIARAPDNVLGHTEYRIETISLKYTMGTTTKWHYEAIRTLSKDIGNLFSNIHEETLKSFDFYLKPGADGWAKVLIHPASTKIIARITNRVFVGLPLCRNENWTLFMEDCAFQVVLTGTLISFFPSFLRSILGSRIARVKKKLRKCLSMVGPIIQEHIDLPEEERPNDFITWLLKAAPQEESNLEAIAIKVMTANFTAIHTSSLTFSQVIYWLLARPKYIAPLREEIAAVTEEYGWTKQAMTRMYKLDSFMKECARISPLTADSLQRKVLVDYTFSDGLFVPAGTLIATHSYAMYQDENIWENAMGFDGFRFSNLPETEVTKHQITNTNRHFLAFGHGKHACPGRFFAANMLKCMLAHLILEYEMKWADPKLPRSGYRPPDAWIGLKCVPNQSTEVMMRKKRS